MDAIKKKMQAMKLEKDNAQDKADAMEGQAKDANMRADKVFVDPWKAQNELILKPCRSKKKYMITPRNWLKLKLISNSPKAIWKQPTET